MIFFALLAIVTPGTDIRSFPSPCTNNWRLACSMNAMESSLAQLHSESQSSDVDTVITNAQNGQYDSSDGFFPWITDRPDTARYGRNQIIQWLGVYNGGLASSMRARLKESLQSGKTCTEIELESCRTMTDCPEIELASLTACSRNLTSEIYATMLTKSNSQGSILCDGETDSACNVWTVANIVGKIQYHLKSKTETEVKGSFVNGDFDHENFAAILIDTSGEVWSHSNTSMPWFITIENYAELAPFTLDTISYKGWKMPVTLDGVQYQLAITYLDAAEATFPASNWASLDASKSSCSPLLQTNGCDSEAISSYIIGKIQQAASNNTIAQLTSQFEAGDFNFGQWTPELRSQADCTVTARGALGLINDITFTEEQKWVIQEAVSTAGQSYVEYSHTQGPIRTYVVPIGTEHYAQISYVDETLTSTSTTAAPSDDDSSNTPTLFAAAALFLMTLMM